MTAVGRLHLLKSTLFSCVASETVMQMHPPFSGNTERLSQAAVAIKAPGRLDYSTARMRLPGWLWLSSAVLAACRAVEEHNLTRGLEDASAQAACPARLEGSGRCEGSQCPFQLTLPTLTLQLPRQFGSMEEVLKEVRTLKEAVDSLKKSCQDCKLQADDHRDPGGNGGNGAETDYRVQELESQVNKLSSELKNAKDEIQGLQGRLETLHLVNMNNIENYVDNKVANLTFVVNSLDGKCSKCPSQEHIQSQPGRCHEVLTVCSRKLYSQIVAININLREYKLVRLSPVTLCQEKQVFSQMRQQK